MDWMLERMINAVCGSNLFADIYETLSINLFSGGGAFSVAYSVAHAVYNSVMTIGVMLLFIYFMLAMVDKFSSENFTWEQLWRQLALLLAGKYLMENGFQILELLFNIGMATAARISVLGDPTTSAVTIDAAEMISEFTSNLSGFYAVIGKLVMLMYLVIPWLLSWIMGLVVNIICYSRVIEIYARVCFAPIALSDMFHSGLNGAGWRSLKSFLAVALQGAMILVIGIMYSALFSSITVDPDPANWFQFTGKYLVLYASAVMLIFKSLSLSKEIVGVG